MMRPSTTRTAWPSALATRLARLGAKDADAQAALAAAITRATPVRQRRELMSEGRDGGAPRGIVSGWAARVRLLLDGRRQFVSFLLPGDLIGVYRQPAPLATSTIIALTDVSVAQLPPPDSIPSLAAAYATSLALEESHLIAQIVRLGRLNAQERIADLLLELHERLALAGLGEKDGFALPLTQEILADALGLTPVHVNRMLQLARRENDLVWRAGHVTLTDPAALTQKVGRASLRVSALWPEP